MANNSKNLGVTSSTALEKYQAPDLSKQNL
jgi:hypothetical protein